MNWQFQPIPAALASPGGPTHTLTTDAGIFALAGQDAELEFVPDEPGAFTLTAGSGSFAFAGQADLRLVRPIQPATNTPLAVQRGILNACTLALVEASVPVFDYVPHNQAFPFVAMNQHQVLPNDGSDVFGFIHVFYISVWSDYRGTKECWEILDRLWRAMHERDLPLENGTMVLCRVTEQRVDTDADGITHMGNLTARIVTNPLSDL